MYVCVPIYVHICVYACTYIHMYTYIQVIYVYIFKRYILIIYGTLIICGTLL